MSKKNKIEKYLIAKYEFVYNVVLGRTLYRKKKTKGSRFELIDEYKFNSLLRELENNDLKISPNQLHNLLISDFVKKFNPFEEYFNNLSHWDGETDYISELAKSVNTTDDELFQWAFKKWIVAMVASAINNDITNHCVLIFVGKQSIGKTRWLENCLLPEELKPYMFSGIINPNDKDSVLQLSECILIIMEEIGAFSRNQVESFKEIITKSIIRKRKPYGHFSENHIRRASFVGTSNNIHLLVDVTGNRRFLVFNTLGFDFEINSNIEKVYSQAFQLYKDGFKYWFDEEDLKKINENNEQYIQTSEEEDYIKKYFERCELDSKEAIFYTATEILEYIASKILDSRNIRLNPVLIGKYLTANDFLTKKINGIRKYAVLLKKINN